MATTVREVARLAGVSLGTVSNYLNDTKPVSATARTQIEAAIESLGFVPNTASRVMRGKRNTAIGFVIPDSGNPFFAEVARGVEDAALAAGLVIVVCNTHGDPVREQRYLRTLAEMRVTGVLVTPTGANDASLRTLRDGGATVVLLDHPHPELELAAIDVDDQLGGELAMQHLLDLGHRTLLFIDGHAGATQYEERYRGARRAIANAGLDPSILRRIETTGESAAARSAIGERVLQMTPRPAGIFAANDLIALAVQATLTRAGVRIPEDVALVGYDDIDLAQQAAVPLTTVRQPMYEIGQEAARLLLEGPAGTSGSDQHVMFEPELVIRASTRPI